MTIPVECLAVESPNEPLVYNVASNEHPDSPHRVDLADAKGHGSCSCRDFETNVTRNRKAYPGKWHFYGTPNDKNTMRTQCRHIAEAQRKLLTTILPSMSDSVNKSI
jgi:hypothetical protein